MVSNQQIDAVPSNDEGRKWCRKLTWSLQNDNPKLEREVVLKGLRQAFSLWQSSDDTDVAFLELGFAQEADIRIYWEEFPAGDHHYGYAEFPPLDCVYEPDAGKIRLNLRYTWTLDERDGPEEPIDLVTLAAHEIGHAIGMEHSLGSLALMHPIYQGSHRFLAFYDRQYYRFLYFGDERPPT